MLRIFRWLFRITTGIVVLLALAAAAVYWLASRSLPDYSGAFRVAGVSAPVEITRDTHAVPHIFGASDEDVYFGLGFTHAQDRLWQMMMLRRTAQGRLSELFGTRTVEIDELLRRLDLYGVAKASVEDQDAPTRAMLQSYAAGVNAWLAQVNEGARGRGAPEYWLFSNEIAPWTEADSLAILKILALQLSGHASQEVLRARLSLDLGEGRSLSDLLPDSPGPGVAGLPKYSALFPEAPKVAAAHPPIADPLSPVKPFQFAGASNAWAADPTRAAGGASLLAGDPHLGFTAPSVWYLARLELQSGGVIGGTVPGMPLVLVGRSDKLGWALTTAYLDDQDVYIEKVNPENANEVLTPEGWKKVRTRQSIINVKDAAPVTMTLRWSENGPILPGTAWDLGSVTPPGHVASLAWTALEPRDTSMSAARAMMNAPNRAAALRALRRQMAPSQNVTLADAEGVAMMTVGWMPARDPAHETQGRMPAPGWEARNRWQGRLPVSDNPLVTDPEGGIVGNTNNRVVDRPFPKHVSFVYGDTQRVHRWEKLMQAREIHTRDSFIEAQLDTVSHTARTLLPLVAGDLWYQGADAPEGTPEAKRQQALDMLANWNGEMSEHTPEPLIYAAWMRKLQERLIEDELGPLAEEFAHPEPLFLARVFGTDAAGAAWCDVIHSARVETCPDIAQMALDDALLWIGETWGDDLESLRWGDVHEARHDHPVLGEIPLLRWLVNIRQSTPGGDDTLLRGRTIGTGPNPFVNVHGAGYRGVYDFADPDSSVFVIATGQAGHPLSRHYDDLGDLWRRGEYIPMTLDPELARAGSEGTITLQPEGTQ